MPRRLRSTPSPAPEAFGISLPATTVGPETREIEVIVYRWSPGGISRFNSPLTLSYHADFYTIPDPWARGGAGVSQPFHPDERKRITFKPGETMKVLTLKLPPMPAGAWSYSASVSVSLPVLGWGNGVQFAGVTVLTSPEKVPPAIVAHEYTPDGLKITFSKPMDPATVQDINNYSVKKLPQGPRPEGDHFVDEAPVALQSAVYDPETRTVTLVPTTPLDPVLYAVMPRGLALDWTTTSTDLFPTDVNGNPCRFSEFIGTDPLTGYTHRPVGTATAIALAAASAPAP